jgi:hypothetical protein
LFVKGDSGLSAARFERNDDLGFEVADLAAPLARFLAGRGLEPDALSEAAVWLVSSDMWRFEVLALAASEAVWPAIIVSLVNLLDRRRVSALMIAAAGASITMTDESDASPDEIEMTDRARDGRLCASSTGDEYRTARCRIRFKTRLNEPSLEDSPRLWTRAVVFLDRAMVGDVGGGDDIFFQGRVDVYGIV